MDKPLAHRFNLPVVKSDLPPERRKDVERRFMQVASLGLALRKPARYGIPTKKKVKKG